MKLHTDYLEVVRDELGEWIGYFHGDLRPKWWQSIFFGDGIRRLGGQYVRRGRHWINRKTGMAAPPQLTRALGERFVQETRLNRLAEEPGYVSAS